LLTDYITYAVVRISMQGHTRNSNNYNNTVDIYKDNLTQRKMQRHWAVKIYW